MLGKLGEKGKDFLLNGIENLHVFFGSGDVPVRIGCWWGMGAVASGRWPVVSFSRWSFSLISVVVGLLPCTKTREILVFSVGGGESMGEFFGKTGFLWWEYFPD
jgi:hypothetical protein